MDWREDTYPHVEYNHEDAKPGIGPNGETTGKSDYDIHVPDRSASWEQEQDFARRAAPILDQLEMLQNGETLETFARKMANESTDTEFDLAVNGTAVQMLTKTDMNTGAVAYRENGEWVDIKKGQEVPALDDADLIAVTGDATAIWDKAEGGELSTRDFLSVALDEPN